MRTRHPAVPVAFALLFLLSCGKSPDAPPAGFGPAMKIVWGTGLSDTIFATPRWPLQELAVQVWGLTGKPERSIGVVFDAGTPGCPGYPYTYHDCSRILLASSYDLSFVSRTTATTDGEGRAAVRIRMGPLAGPASVKITVPGFYLADSAAFTVLPGSAYTVRRLLPDTTVELGGTFAARGGVVDWPGNLRSDPVTFDATSPAVQVSGATVSAVAVGLAYVRVRGAVGGTTATDSAGIMVVPKARLAVVLGGLVSLESLAGGAVRPLVHTSGFAGPWCPCYGLAWSPTGDRFAFATGSGLLASTDTLGNATALATPGVAVDPYASPEYSRDGLWVYFSGDNGHGRQVFRVHPDGTGLEALQSPGDAGWWVSPSPDGTRFAYTGGNGRLLLRTIATGHVDTLTTTGFTGVRLTRWSPDGNWIAFVDQDSWAIGLIRPDGSGLRNLGGFGWDGVSWSPDSKWLVTPYAGRLVLVDVTAGTFYLTTTFGFQAAWRP